MVERTTITADTIVWQSTIPITYPKERSWFLQGIRWHIHCTPFVRKLSTFSFPCLQEQSSPHNVEDVEEEDTPITCHLASVGQEEGDDTQDSRCHQPFGVHTQPGKIHGNFNTEVLADFVCEGKRNHDLKTCNIYINLFSTRGSVAVWLKALTCNSDFLGWCFIPDNTPDTKVLIAKRKAS